MNLERAGIWKDCPSDFPSQISAMALDTPRLKINFLFRWFRSSLRMWATAALTWAEGERTWSEPKHAYAELENPEHPEHAPKSACVL